MVLAVFACLVFSVYAESGSYAKETVYFNTSSLKVHKMSCPWVARCTKNCISLPREEAYKRGGIPCKVCGG